MYIFKLTPVLKDYIWGGRRLIDDFHMRCEFEKAAEAWILSCHKDGMNIVENGAYQGKKFCEVLTNEMMGTNCAKFDKFPILTKIIDARDNLSLQVHPSDETAIKENGEEGKTESWYIADCDEDAQIIYGFKKDITKEEFLESINDGTFIDKVNTVKVKAGECYHIEAGTLHAICKGVLLYEVQQNSNTTFRVYDYDRVDSNGQKRELHVDRALEVTNYKKHENTYFDNHITEYVGAEKKLLSKCEFYTFSEICVDGLFKQFADEKSFIAYTVVSGNGEISCLKNCVELKKGDCVFVPAGLGDFVIDGKMKILEMRVDEWQF